MHVKPSDTIIFKAYGYAGKMVCIADSMRKPHYKISVKVKRLIDTTNDEDFAKMYSFIINVLYVRFSKMDTSKKFIINSDDLSQK